MQGKRILLLAACLMTSSAFAACMSVPEGWYVEGNVGSTSASNKSYPGSSSASGIGGNVNVGYKFMPYLGLELGYSRYANTSIKDTAGTRAATDKRYSYDIAGKGIVPIGAFELFAKVGVDRMNSHVSIDNSAAAASIGMTSSQHSATGLYLGAGAQYYFIPEMAVVGQWQRAQGSSSTGNMDLYTLGVSFIIN